MDPSFESQPRDSRLERFSAAASNIISIERGLTATALNKIRHLANEQRLSEDQVSACLDRIGDGGSALGRVGRYEQVFLDRLNADLAKTNASVLSPQESQTLIRLAGVEYQISSSRAQQLLDYAAKQRGLQQISAADARNRIRAIIEQRLESSDHRQGELDDEIVSHAANFGISADEVKVLWDAEIQRHDQERHRRKTRFIAVTGSVLTAVLAVAVYWLWLNAHHRASADPTTTEPIVAPKAIAIEDAQAPPIDPTPDVSNNEAPQEILDLPPTVAGASQFEIGDLLRTPNTARILRFEKWQARFLELIGKDFEQSLPDANPPTLAERQKKQDALDALKSDSSNARIHARALDDLSVLTQSIGDITPEEATSIAAFCFHKHSASTEVAIIRAVKPFGRWPNFLLAVADVFADKKPQKPTDSWNQRIAFAITDGKMRSNENLSASFFALARSKLKELLKEHEHNSADVETNIEGDFAEHLRQFIAENISDRLHQRYFNHLIDIRDLKQRSMQRRIELQQILIEALLFAKRDDASQSDAETYFSRLNSAKTLGEQLALSRQTTISLVSRHLQWLKETTAAPPPLEQRLSLRINVTRARRLRDEAEDAAMTGDTAEIENAVAKYKAAIDSGDAATIRSCLRGLMAIAQNQTDRNRYRRQLGLVNGVHSGPLSKFASDDGDENNEGNGGNVNSPQIVCKAIIRQCQQLRRGRTPREKPADREPTKPDEIVAALNWLASSDLPLTSFELDRLLQIEAEAMEMMDAGRTSFSAILLPTSVQAALPPVDVTPLVPLGR